MALTNAASSLSLEQVATVLVFILSVVILKERITVLKVVSLMVSRREGRLSC